MLNRRYLRIKLLKALYAIEMRGNEDFKIVEKDLINSFDNLFRLYLRVLLLLIELKDTAIYFFEMKQNRRVSENAASILSKKFIDNAMIHSLENNVIFQTLITKHKVNWTGHGEFIRNLFRAVEQSEYYLQYMKKTESGFKVDKDLVLNLFKEVISSSESLHHLLEEESIHNYDDLNFVNSRILFSLERYEDGKSDTLLTEVLKDKKDDLNYISGILSKVSDNKAQYNQWIEQFSQNWEIDRIAVMDKILLKMALVELTEFPYIPVKVTINEYIDISKLYSTPKSKLYINGVLDRLHVFLKDEGLLNKKGRGMLQ